ncbi:Extracellular calcium-sensing receptor [Holothuria leucospilota]|uniref:Extracellular calcium-sensing receptor n=1 Tax=Holothuria leucospilota TaxID=206669 RepID=A0A9Q0YQJ7_HOLLE|nr:Extracellular calcium-sensing receptor [Holothuria leucospilota]
MGIMVGGVTHIGLPTHALCSAQRIVKSPLVTAAIMCFVVKTQQVIKLFKTKVPKEVKHRYLQVVFVIIMAVLQSTVIVTYTIVRPPEVSYDYDTSPQYVYVNCVDATFAFVPRYLVNNFLILVCFVFTFRARHLPHNFGESRYITYGVGCAYCCWFAFLPPLFLTYGRTRAFYELIVIFTQIYSLQSFYFFPKCYVIIFHPEKNTVQTMRKSTLRHMRRRSSRVHIKNIPLLPIPLCQQERRLGNRARTDLIDDIILDELGETNIGKGTTYLESAVISTISQNSESISLPHDNFLPSGTGVKPLRRMKTVTFLEGEISSNKHTLQKTQTSNKVNSCIRPFSNLNEKKPMQVNGNHDKFDSRAHVKMVSKYSNGKHRDVMLPGPSVRVPQKEHSSSQSNLLYVTDGISRHLYHKKLNFIIDLGHFDCHSD